MRTDRYTNNLNKKKSHWLTDILYIMLLAVFGYVLRNLFYHQSIEYKGGYNSDTWFYIHQAKQTNGTRMISYLFHRLYEYSGDHWLIVTYMAIVVIATVFANYFVIKTLIKSYSERPPRQILQLASIIALFSGSIYLPKIHPYFYRNSWPSYAWHSPTQQTMMLFGLIAIVMFIKIYENYLFEIKKSQWIVMMICSALATWSKPTFLLVMAPTVVILFLIELFSNREHSFLYRFRRLVLFGLAFIPAGIYTLLFYFQYFGEGGNAGGGGVAVGFKRFMEGENLQILIGIVCGLLFPIIVFIFNIKSWGEFRYKFALIFFGVSAAEGLLFYEEGIRETHGNFSWGRMMGCYYFFICGLAFAIDNFHDKNFLNGNKFLRTVYFGALAVALALHLLTQLYFFYSLVRGHSYFH